MSGPLLNFENIGEVQETHFDQNVMRPKIFGLRSLNFLKTKDRHGYYDSMGGTELGRSGWLFSSIFMIWDENHPLNADVYLTLSWQLQMSDSQFENFVLPNHGKFAVECDKIVTFLKCVGTLVCSLKKLVSLKEKLIFLTIGKIGKFVECVSNDIIS